MLIQTLFYLFLFSLSWNLIPFINWIFEVEQLCLLSFIFLVAFYYLLLKYLVGHFVFYCLLLSYLDHLLGLVFLIVFCLIGCLLERFLLCEIIFLIIFILELYFVIRFLFRFFLWFIVVSWFDFLIVFILSFYFLFCYFISLKLIRFFLGFLSILGVALKINLVFMHHYLQGMRSILYVLKSSI